MSANRHRLCTALALCLLPAASWAQQTGANARTTARTFAALDRLDSFTPDNRFAGASPGDPDLGEQILLTRQDRYRPFSAELGYSTVWTSNAFYTPNNPASDLIMSGWGQIVALPHLGHNFFLDTAARIAGYRYFANPVLDFNSLDVAAGVLKVFREFYDVGLYGRYEYSFLWDPNGGEILHENSLVTGVRKTFQFSRVHALFVGAEADFSLGGWPGYALAHDFNISIAHQIQWSRFFNTSLFYQMAVYDFRENNRADLRNSLGLTAGFRPVRWVTLSGTAWLGWNASNQSEYDYFVGNLGGAINASVNF